jgi:hypothetical protein
MVLLDKMLQIIKLDSEEGIKNYDSLLSTLNISEPFFLKDYIDIFSNGLENVICFTYNSSKSNAYIIMPGYLKPIVIGGEKTNYFEFVTPYGYTGPIYSKTVTDIDIKEFWSCVDEWYKDNNVVTEFIRFNLFGNQEHYSGKIVMTLLNVKGKIIEKENQWLLLKSNVRKNINKAKRENLYSEVYFSDISDQKIAEFHNIYIQTMKRNSAKETFFFSFKDFKRFINNNEKHCAICTIYFQDIPISSELLLISEHSIYSFLGGTDDNYFDKRPNDFLKFEALNWSRNQGKKHYVLGGGYKLEDGIFKYKKGFFPDDIVNYYTGRKILNKKIYDQLVTEASDFRLLKGLDKLDVNDNSFFPLYNKLD